MCVSVWHPKAGRANGTSGRVCVCGAEGRTREWDQRTCVCVALEDQVCVWRGPGVCGEGGTSGRVCVAPEGRVDAYLNEESSKKEKES